MSSTRAGTPKRQRTCCWRLMWTSLRVKHSGGLSQRGTPKTLWGFLLDIAQVSSSEQQETIPWSSGKEEGKGSISQYTRVLCFSSQGGHLGEPSSPELNLADLGERKHPTPAHTRHPGLPKRIGRAERLLRGSQSRAVGSLEDWAHLVQLAGHSICRKPVRIHRKCTGIKMQG